MLLTYSRKYISFLLIGIMGIVFPLLLSYENLTLQLLFPSSLILYTITKLSIIIFKEDFRLLEISFFIFVYVFFGIAPLAQINSGNYPWGGLLYGNREVSMAYLIIIIGVIGYEIGIILGKNRLQNISSSLSTSYSYKNMSLSGLIIFTTFSLIFFMVSTGVVGINHLFLPRNMNLIDNVSDTGLTQLFQKFQQVPLFIALIFSLTMWKLKKSKGVKYKYDLWLLIIILFLLISNLIISNPISSGRYWIGTIYLSILFVLAKWKESSQTYIIIAFLILLLVIFPYADIFRNSLNANLEIKSLSTVLSTGDFDAFQQVMNGIIYTDIYNYSFGHQLLGVIFFWLPRTIWESKPFGTGYTIGEGLGYDFLNISASLWVEFFVNFGFLGVFILFIFYGYLSAYMQKRYVETIHQKDISFYSVFLPIFAAYQLFLLRGDLLSSFAYLSPLIIFSLIGILIFNFNKAKNQIDH